MKFASDLRLGLLSLVVGGWVFAGPAAAESFVEIFETLRPVVGRSSELLLVGELPSAEVLQVEQIEVQHDPARVTVTLLLYPYSFPFLNQYAIPVELPPLSQPLYDVVVKAHREGQPPFLLGQTFFRTRLPLAASLIDGEVPGTYRIRVQAQTSDLRLEGPPKLDGKILSLPISLGCDEECIIDPPPPILDLEATSDAIELLDQEYTLELTLAGIGAKKARVALRERVKAGDGVLLRDGRFRVHIALDPPATQTPGLVAPPTADSALFYFFSRENWEVMVKVLDGCAINGNFWVFAAASTDVGYELIVEDLAKSRIRSYPHAAGTPAPAVTDTLAFPCN